MRSGFLLFCFSTDEQTRLGTVTATDIDYAAAPAPGAPYPQALRLAFRLRGTGALPQVRPLFPGKMRFIPDPAAPGAAPSPAQVEFTPEAYAGWRTVGTILLEADTAVAQEIATLDTGLEEVPNVIWYGPVRISQEFLFTTLRTRLVKDVVGTRPGIKGTDRRWERHAVALFLQGRYEARLRAGDSAANDDRLASPMPTVHPVDAQGNVTLLISAARRQLTPMDGNRRRLSAHTPGVSEDDPAHARNGALPARDVLRRLRQHLTGGDAGAAVPDAVMTEGPVYHAIRFTRTWQPLVEYSVHFPGQQVVVASAAGAELARQRLPVHGVFFWSRRADQPAGELRVSISGDMRWIDGRHPQLWRLAAGTTPVTIDLAAQPSPHVQLRLPMRQAMLVEAAPDPEENRCTYMSIRRTVRALVDNRICGGRLSFGTDKTNAATARLIDEAFEPVRQAHGIPARSGLVSDNKPDPWLEPRPGSVSLLPVLRVFFPHDVDPVQLGNSTARTTVYDGGEQAFRIWQSLLDDLLDEGKRRNFSNEHVGRGGPGAMVARELATDFHVDPQRAQGETKQAYLERVVRELSTGLEPGAVLQFWTLEEDFEGIKNAHRDGTDYAVQDAGHSPIFRAYIGPPGRPTHLQIIDQYGISRCPIDDVNGSPRIHWDDEPREIWIAANWAE